MRHLSLFRVVPARSRLARDEGGQISALGVMAAAAFASLLLLVINTGSATSGKIEMQTAADATAISGATWVARGLNIISMDNITETQLLAIAIIIPALNDAMPFAQGVLELENLASCLDVFGGEVLCALTNEQLYGVPLGPIPFLYFPGDVWAAQTAQSVLGSGREGFLWQAMQALTAVSGAVKVAFGVVAIAEGYRIAGQNGADAGVLIPARPTKTAVFLPVHKGTLGDLCDHAQAPLDSYSDTIDLALIPIANSLIHAFFYAARAVEFQAICGGSAPSLTAGQTVRSLAECQARGGGTAVWTEISYVTTPYNTRQSSFSISSPSDPHLAGPIQRDQPVTNDCSWTPPGKPMGGNRYQTFVEIPQTTTDANGQPVTQYSYQVTEYTFSAAEVSGPVTEMTPAGAPDDPAAYMLGSDDNPTPEDAKLDMHYLALTYRSRGVAVAPKYFVSPLGDTRLSYSQVVIYNPTAFDLFTQDWRVSLEPASLLENNPTLNSVSDSSGLLSKVSGLFSGPVKTLLSFLNNH